MPQRRLRQFIRMVLIEGKLDDLKSANPEHSSTLDSVAKIGVKYLDWSVKQLKKGASSNDLIPTLEFFHKNAQRFEKKDIGAYSTLSELEDAVKSLPEKSKTKAKSEAKTEGAEKLFEDEMFILLHIKSKDAAVCYGSGTKWCITMKNASYFEEYTDENAVFYFVIDKTRQANDPLSKVAFAVKRNGENGVKAIEIYDTTDAKISCPANMTRLLERAKIDASNRPMSKMMKFKLGKLSQDDLLSMIKNKNESVRLEVARRIDPKHLPQMVNDEEYNVRAEVAKRIDSKYLPQMMEDEYPSVRVNVAERIDLKYLPQMMDDSESFIRAEVAKRIDSKYLPQMMEDEDSGVRFEVAKRVDPEHLVQMMKDEHSYIRLEVAKRIDSKYLPQMMEDEHPDVRIEVARRVDPEHLVQMMDDEDWNVRLEVAKDIAQKHLPQMMKDKEYNVRVEVAKRIDPKYLPQMMKDSSWFVKQVVDERLKQLSS